MESTTSRVVNGDVELFVREYGSPDADLVIALHGWPDSSRGWAKVAPLLATRYRVITPDNRGFGDSSRPVGTDRYRMRELILDVMAVADHAGADRFHLIGHDFGSAVTWAVGMLAPQRVRRAVNLAGPHPQVMHRAAGNLRQIGKSAYTFLMNIGEPGERLLTSENFGLLERFAFGTIEAISAEDRAAYRADWARPGAFTAMAEWYRAHYTPDLLNPDVHFELPPVRVPTMYVHGANDFAFIEELAEGNGDYVDAEYEEHVLATNHWMLYERPAEVAELILDWLGRS
jgi:pimeloyl-ACP methyl ester carboxylesterase